MQFGNFGIGEQAETIVSKIGLDYSRPIINLNPTYLENYPIHSNCLPIVLLKIINSVIINSLIAGIESFDLEIGLLLT